MAKSQQKKAETLNRRAVLLAIRAAAARHGVGSHNEELHEAIAMAERLGIKKSAVGKAIREGQSSRPAVNRKRRRDYVRNATETSDDLAKLLDATGNIPNSVAQQERVDPTTPEFLEFLTERAQVFNDYYDLSPFEDFNDEDKYLVLVNLQRAAIGKTARDLLERISFEIDKGPKRLDSIAEYVTLQQISLPEALRNERFHLQKNLEFLEAILPWASEGSGASDVEELREGLADLIGKVAFGDELKSLEAQALGASSRKETVLEEIGQVKAELAVCVALLKRFDTEKDVALTGDKAPHAEQEGKASVTEAKEQFGVAHDAVELGHLIREARKAAGLSQIQLAEAMGTAQGAITRLETGRTMPTLATLEKVAAATGTELSISLAPKNE